MAAPRGAGAPSTGPNRGMRGWLRGLHVSGFSLLMLGLLVLAVVILAPTLHLYIAQRQEISDVQASVATTQHQVDSARSQLARWSDPSYVRSQVRDRLYYVMPGETSYLIIDDRSAAQKRDDSQPVSKKIQTTKTDWLDTLLVSTLTAGVTDAAPETASTGAPESTPAPKTSHTPKG